MKKISKFIVFGIIAIIIIGTFKFLSDSSRPELTIYEILSPTIGNVENSTTITGNIEARNEIEVKPEISGTIKRLLKEVGNNVVEGEIIATLNIIPDAGQLSSAESRLRVAEINLEQVSKEYTRQKMLYENDVISKNDYEIIEAGYYKALEEKENAEDALEIIKTGTSINSNMVNNTQVRSSVRGTILDIPVKVGTKVIPSNVFSDGTTIARVANMNDLIFKGTIDESEVGKIWEGMPVSIFVAALPNEKIDAVLEYIAPKGNKENGTVLYEIKAAIKMSKSTLIRANYSANANIIMDSVENVIKIPESSVEFNKNGSIFVYVLNKGDSKTQSFTKTPIEIGLSDGNYVEVKSGITVYDRIRGMKIDNQK